MPQVSHPIDDSWVSDASDQYSRCLEIAHQVQLAFIRTPCDADCFLKLAGALRIETGSAAVFIGATSSGTGTACELLTLATHGTGSDSDAETIWSAEAGQTVSVPEGPLLAALTGGLPVKAREPISARHLMIVPLLIDDVTVGVVGLASDRTLLPDLPGRIAPVLETCSVLIAARVSGMGETRPEVTDEPSSGRDILTSVGVPPGNQSEILSAILDNDPDYIAVVDAGGVVQFINRVDSGYDVESVIGTTILDYQLPEFRKLSRKMLRRVFRDGQAVSVETLGGGPERDIERFFAVRAIPLRVNGAVQSALLIGTDITERKRIQESTAQSESLLQAMGEVTTEFVYVKDRDSRMIFCNSGASDFLGLTRQQQMGTDESDHYPDTVARRIRDDDLRVMATGKTRTYEEVLPSDAGDRVFLTTKSPWRDKEGRVLGVVGLSQDITERKRTERALAASEARLRTIIDMEPSCVCLIARDGKLLDINASGLRMAEAASFDEMRDLAMSQLFSEDCREQFEDLHRRVCRGETCDAQLEIVGLQGTLRTVEHYAVPFAYSPGWTVHLGITRDVTAQRSAEETIAQQQGQLLHVSRLSTMGQMVAAISHEITQPLSAISNFAAACSLLLGKPNANSIIEEHVESIQKQSERAGSIITRIRNFARRTDPHRSTCDLRKLVNDALDLGRADLRRRGVSVEFTSPEPTVFVLADRVQIQQVLMNLISNACDAMQEQPPADRRIWIKCSFVTQIAAPESFDTSTHTPDYVESVEQNYTHGCVEITDNGPGTDNEQLLQMFDPFYTSKPQGMGIGLSICRDIIRSHGGSIDASQTDDRGARFRFTLPSSGGASDD